MIMEKTDGEKRMNPAEIRAELEKMAEPEYHRFSSSLIPNIPKERILGVRLPKLRRMASCISREDWRTYLDQARDDSFEEVMLQGMVIGSAKGSLEEMQGHIRRFLPKIDNWSVCDSFCSGLKLAKTNPEEMWKFLQPYFVSDREYDLRFAVVMLLNYYAEEAYREQALKLLEQIDHPSYYVKMAAAWAISVFYVRFPEAVMAFLQQARLDDFTYNKTLQKIIESRQVSKEVKDVMRRMKRKGE